MATLITKFQALPDGVRGVVYEFLPRHDTASLMAIAIKEGILKLKYVNIIPKNHSQHNYLNFMGDVYLITRHLKELRPTVLRQDTYGDGVIQRINISVGERVRLRRINQITR
tara:strand:+ start:5672 stop:6007 length:336 start_codon:yes stop_codon:yes gene_type:complete